MQCKHCGTTVDGQTTICPGCLMTPVSRPEVPADMQQYETVQPALAFRSSIYAGFWKRFAAQIIDTVLLSVFSYLVLLIVLFALIGPNEIIRLSEIQDPALTANDPLTSEFAFIILAWIPFVYVAHWLYSGLMESSRLQATVGKLALGIVVTDTMGKRISFGRASARTWSKIISGLTLLIGYLMAAFTPRKQALHDLIADTLVVCKR